MGRWGELLKRRKVTQRDTEKAQSYTEYIQKIKDKSKKTKVKNECFGK